MNEEMVMASEKESAPVFEPVPAPVRPIGTKDFTVAWILSLLLGGLGIDRFYLGKIGTGILKLITFAGFGIWYLIDLIIILAGGASDKWGNALAKEPKSRGKYWAISAAVIVALLIFSSISNAINGTRTTSSRDENVGNGASSIDTPAPSPAKTELPTPVQTKAPEPKIPSEYKSALKQAQDYSDLLHLSKAGLYDQLVSEYGGQFSAEAAQYAIDNVKADWNANALAQAVDYQNSLSLSPSAIRDQLTSEYGGKFLPEEADYAIANLP